MSHALWEKHTRQLPTASPRIRYVKKNISFQALRSYCGLFCITKTMDKAILEMDQLVLDFSSTEPGSSQHVI